MKKLSSILVSVLCLCSLLVSPVAVASNRLDSASARATSAETIVTRPIRVACVGDSVTYGATATPQATMNYPAQLQRLLGDGYQVRNFGFNGRCMNDNNYYKYIGTVHYNNSIALKPDIIFIMLGINDSKDKCWESVERFKESARTLIRSYQALDYNPKIYIMTTPAVGANTTYPGSPADDIIKNSRIATLIAPAQREIAAELGCELIDMNLKTTEMANNGTLGDFLASDNVHPNNNGYGIIAKDAYDAIMSAEHAITVTPSQHGTVTASKATAKSGETISLTVLPDEGYQLESGSLQVNGVGITGTTFSMPGLDTVVTARFEKVSAISGQVRSSNFLNETTISLYASTDTSHTNALYTTTIPAQSGSSQQTQPFTLSNVVSGTYDLVVTKAGHLPYTITGVVVTDTDLDLTTSSKAFVSTITLLSGDLNNDGLIDSADLATIYESGNYHQTVPSNSLTDLDGDGRVNISDVNIICNIANQNKSTSDSTFPYGI